MKTEKYSVLQKEEVLSKLFNFVISDRKIKYANVVDENFKRGSFENKVKYARLPHSRVYLKEIFSLIINMMNSERIIELNIQSIHDFLIKKEYRISLTSVGNHISFLEIAGIIISIDESKSKNRNLFYVSKKIHHIKYDEMVDFTYNKNKIFCIEDFPLFYTKVEERGVNLRDTTTLKLFTNNLIKNDIKMNVEDSNKTDTNINENKFNSDLFEVKDTEKKLVTKAVKINVKKEESKLEETISEENISEENEFNKKIKLIKEKLKVIEENEPELVESKINKEFNDFFVEMINYTDVDLLINRNKVEAKLEYFLAESRKK